MSVSIVNLWSCDLCGKQATTPNHDPEEGIRLADEPSCWSSRAGPPSKKVGPYSNTDYHFCAHCTAMRDEMGPELFNIAWKAVQAERAKAYE